LRPVMTMRQVAGYPSSRNSRTTLI